MVKVTQEKPSTEQAEPIGLSLSGPEKWLELARQERLDLQGGSGPSGSRSENLLSDPRVRAALDAIGTEVGKVTAQEKNDPSKSS